MHRTTNIKLLFRGFTQYLNRPKSNIPSVETHWTEDLLTKFALFIILSFGTYKRWKSAPEKFSRVLKPHTDTRRYNFNLDISWARSALKQEESWR